MSADDIVSVNIDLKSKGVTAAGFGRPLFLSCHTHWLARTKLYSASTGLDDMITDGFLTTDKTYHDVQVLLSQAQTPVDFKIGRRALFMTEITNLIPTVTVQGFVYSGTLDDVDWSYTVLAGATVATISTAIAALLTGLALGLTCSGASTTWCACTATVTGKVHRFTNTVPELHIANVTTDPGIATDLANIRAVDNDWFGVCLDSQSKAETLAAAAYLETARKVTFSANADYAQKDPASTTDLMYVAKANAYFNTAIFYHHESGSSLAAGAMARYLTSLPGTQTLAHLQVVGVVTSDVAPNGSPWCSDADAAAIKGKNGNTYTTLGNQGDIQMGTVAGGDHADTVRAIHFMHARIQEMYITNLQNGGYRMTNKGISKANNDLLALLLSWTKNPYTILDDDPTFAPTVTTPQISDLSQAEKKQRKLPNVQFTGRVQGAIELIEVSGSISI